MDAKLAALAAHVSQGTERAPAVGPRTRRRRLRRRAGPAYATRRGSRPSGSWTTTKTRSVMEDGLPAADDRTSRTSSRPQERADIAADLEDLGADARRLPAAGRQGRRDRVPGLRAEPLLRVGAPAGQPRAHARHRRAADARARVRHRTRTSTSSGTTGRATSTPSPTTGLAAGPHDRASRHARGARRRSTPGTRYCPRCGRQLGAIRLYQRAARPRVSRSARPGRCWCGPATSPSESQVAPRTRYPPRDVLPLAALPAHRRRSSRCSGRTASR